MPVSASASSRCPLPATPATPTISPPRTCQRDAVQRGQPAVTLGVQVVGLQHDIAERRACRSRRRPVSTSRPTISAARPSGVALAVATVATTRPPRSTVMRSETASTSCSLCEMKTIGAAVGRHRAQRLEERARLLRRQHRGRLVEDQDARVAVERLEDLDALLLADRELPDARARVDGEAELIRQRGHLALERGAVGHEPPVALVAQGDVLRDGERLDETEVLVHHPDPALQGIARRAQVDGLAVQLERALVRPVEARDDVRERALARAVLAQQRVHLARVDLEVHVGVRDDAGEALRDAPQRHRGNGGDTAGIAHGRTISPWGSRRRP